MFHLIYKYLILNGEVAVPGIGMFILNKQPSSPDPENNVIHAPFPVIKLKTPVTADNKKFYQFISQETNTNAFDAVKDLQVFSEKLKHEVQLKKWVELPGMGILTQGVRDEIKFKSSTALQEYYPPVAAENITSTEGAEAIATTTHTSTPLYDSDEIKTQRDFWWIAAIILILIGVAGIAYYYYYMQPFNTSIR